VYSYMKFPVLVSSVFTPSFWLSVLLRMSYSQFWQGIAAVLSSLLYFKQK
jgi:hypothetical protein